MQQLELITLTKLVFNSSESGEEIKLKPLNLITPEILLNRAGSSLHRVIDKFNLKAGTTTA